MSVSIAIAPISNDLLRDWPLEYYRDLAQLLVNRFDATVSFLGSREQRFMVGAAIRSLPSDRFRNLCGTQSWSESGAVLRSSACVVANNSGIAHYAAELGVPVVVIFAASHNPYEWRPHGPAVTLLMKRTGCAPCAIGELSQCPYDKRCLREIPPDAVFSVVAKQLAIYPPADRRAG
jgi:heptosyltransferase II